MSNITWTVEGNSEVLRDGKERLVELITQCSDTFYALILTNTYAISYKHWGKEVYTATRKGIKIATIFNKNDRNLGCIQFADTEFRYSFHFKKGLLIFRKGYEKDGIVYNGNGRYGEQQQTILIDYSMLDLPTDRLLLLVTLGKLLFSHFIKQEAKHSEEIFFGSFS